jgi:hypothetical protein
LFIVRGVEVQIPSHRAKPYGYVPCYGCPNRTAYAVRRVRYFIPGDRGQTERGKKMPYMKSSHITSKVDGRYQVGDTLGESSIFLDSQFLPARDGSWLMVDWIPDRGNWYVTEGI